MAWTPDRIAALLRDQSGGASERTEHLSELVAGLRDGIDEDLAAVVEKIADGARDREFNDRNHGEVDQAC